MRAATRERGSRAARELVARVDLRATGRIDVEALAVALGARVVRGRLDGAQARLVASGRRAVIRLSERVTHAGAQRFSVAHELGHLVLAHGAPVLAELCAGGAGAGGGRTGSGDAEVEANAFAAELLMPERAIDARCAGRMPDLSLADAIADAHGVSLLAAAVRMVELSRDRCAAVLVQGGRVAWAAMSASFPEPIARGRTVDERSSALRCRVTGVAGAVFEWVPADVWGGGTAGAREPLLEQAIWIADLQATLALVWLPKSAEPRA